MRDPTPSGGGVSAFIVVAALACGAGSAASECPESSDGVPLELSCTGLYEAQAAPLTYAATALPYTPGVTFWSDGAEKQRYLELLRDSLTSPMKMEIIIADGDGKNARQITNFGCASFAPSFTPDGKKIIFASNKHNCDGRKFELFLMNNDGSGLEQVTDFGGFSSFAEFSPDGKTLVFASDKDSKSRYEFNIFTAEWTK